MPSAALCITVVALLLVLLSEARPTKAKDMQSFGDERVHSCYHNLNAALKLVLSQGEGTEAMPLWVSQRPEPQAVYQLSQH
ncbi:hypothetical protein SO802_002426 [Lithocarpus litseifolius]|uniref:Uncharacterized protein n=1 Tax=Lithocarpus litseifolius TaxID=425828 RepID=A0AAW2DXP8_9ROSI